MRKYTLDKKVEPIRYTVLFRFNDFPINPNKPYLSKFDEEHMVCRIAQ